MARYKYPYIADKTLYKAVMFACAMIRENGYFNKAVSTASDYYDVSEERITEEIRKRQGAGQRGKGKKYKWYIVDEYTEYIYRDEFSEHKPNIYDLKVVRAVDLNHANKSSEPYGWGYQNESYCVDRREAYGEFDTKAEAENKLAELIKSVEED